MHEYLNNKNVLFITTKNLDYIRNTQEIALLEKCALSYRIIGSYSRSYFVRLLRVYIQLFAVRVSLYDTVMIGFAPQLIVPVWYWKLRKANIIIDFFISLYDTMCCDRKKFSSNGFLGKLCHRIDKYTLKVADAVICDTKAHGSYFCDEFQCNKDKLVTMYLEADSNIYYPRFVEKPEFLKDKYIVLYFGSVLPLQGVDIVFKAMDLLRDRKEFLFFFIGPIGDTGLIHTRPISDNIQYIDWLEQEKLAEYIAMSDLCLAGHFSASIEKASRTIPGKAYVYKAMGKPMILGDNAANHELFENDDKVRFVEMGNERALANEIIEFRKREFILCD